MKKYANAAIAYSFLALAGGVFYREFTKFNGFEGATSLGFVHPHYLMLGVFFFLALIVFDSSSTFRSAWASSSSATRSASTSA